MKIARRACSGLLLSMLLAAAGTPLIAKDKGKKSVASGGYLDEWLVLGPVTHPLPVFLEESDVAEDLELDKLLGDEPFSGDWPRPSEGREIVWFGGEALRWESAPADKRGRVTLTPPPDSALPLPVVALLATRVTVDRWAEIEVELIGSDVRCAWIDGEKVVDCGGGWLEGEDDKKAEAIADEVELTPGTHLLIVQTVRDPHADGSWTCGAALSAGDEDSKVEIVASLGERDLGMRDILDAPKIDSLALAPDGLRVVTAVSRFVPGSDDAESWIEIREIPGGRVERASRQRSAGSVGWSDDGRYVSWLAGEGDDRSLYLMDRETGRTFPLLDGIDGLAGYLWSPNSRVIAYWTTVKAEPDERGVKRLEGLRDRWATFRDKDYLHLVTIPDGVVRALTAGELTTSAEAFSPDGKRLLFHREIDDPSRRPYSYRELWEVDLVTFDAIKLRDMLWFSGASYAPDSRRLLIVAQPSEFGAAGLDVPSGAVANSYDSQLFLWDPDTDEVEAITRKFDPAVVAVRWSRHDGRIYLVGEDRDRRRLYRYDLDSREFATLETGYEVVTDLALAERAPAAAVLASSAWEPEGLVTLDLRSGFATRSEHPADGWYDGVRRGSVEPWDFKAASGKTIQGRIYLPPGFDTDRKYPGIVYYYGGTSPVDRRFGGRYPKEWWASRGYVVYVLQPSGATGFGQSFSALHVNDWGRTTSDEIIEGTRKFLEAHAYVDPRRVGSIGASYGGFMTMLLSTRTDLYAAAVSHAGISSIASYWGEGYWGYSYNSVAAAESFPWNRKDLFVEQSPLFRADQAQVPILLTHGRADTNVPVGESDAFYVALKLLGKQVEYVQVEGQDHWILDHDKRLIWSSTILAWFDHWLKGQPEWWDGLFPD